MKKVLISLVVLFAGCSQVTHHPASALDSQVIQHPQRGAVMQLQLNTNTGLPVTLYLYPENVAKAQAAVQAALAGQQPEQEFMLGLSSAELVPQDGVWLLRTTEGAFRLQHADLEQLQQRMLQLPTGQS